MKPEQCPKFDQCSCNDCPLIKGQFESLKRDFQPKCFYTKAQLIKLVKGLCVRVSNAR